MGKALVLQGSEAEFVSQKPSEGWADLVVNWNPNSMAAETEIPVASWVARVA